jgi:DNA polymerase-3 subunit gamma/tau
MAYQVIARKYRPQRFSEVVGQDHVTRTLAHAIEQNRIAHAYLFCGPRGTGKTTIARIFAKCLNCTQGPRVDFSDDDPRCREIAEGRSLDVLEIDGASNRGIDEIRELRETVRYVPSASRFKVYIIDEVHMLTKEAFNALLKTLEEPPEHAKFLFATTEPEKVLPTILSRCQRFDLQRISTRLIVNHLAMIAGKENVTVETSALYAIARGADGGLRDAESTLDQLISFCGNHIREADVLSMFGLAAQSQLLDLSDALIGGDFAVSLQRLDELSRQGKDLGRLVSELLQHFRNLLILQVLQGDPSLLEVSEQEAEVLLRQSGEISQDALARVLDILTDCETRLRDAVSRKIALEVTLYRIVQARQAVSVEELLTQLRELRGARGGVAAPASGEGRSPARGASRPPARGASSASAPKPAVARPEPAPAPALPAAEPPPPAATPPPAAAGPPSSLEALWQQLLESVGRTSAFMRSYFAEATPLSLQNKVLSLEFPAGSADHLALVDTPKNRSLLQSKLAELGCAGVQVIFAIKPGQPPLEPVAQIPSRAASPPPSAPSPSASAIPSSPSPPSPAKAAQRPSAAAEPEKLDPEEFKNDPLIRKALEIFKGRIVEVRAGPKSPE